MDHVRRARLAGQIGGCGAGAQVNFVFIAGDARDDQRAGGGASILNQVDTVLIEPLLRDRCRKVGLILMVSHYYFYLEAMIAPFLYSLMSTSNRGRPG